MHRPGFTAFRDGGFHRGEQAVGQLTFAVFECFDHGFDHGAVREHVTGRHTLLAGHGVVVAEGLRAAEMCGLAEVVNRNDLAVLAVAVAGQDFV